MASTKQMQARAKERRKIQEFNTRIVTQQQHIRNQMEAVAPDIDIVPCGPLQICVMYENFRQDYAQAGDAVGQGGISDSKDLFKIVYQNQAVGFIRFCGVATAQGQSDDVKLIELAYIEPEFRGLGIMSAVYNWALYEYGAEGIEISYQRVTGLEHYWFSQGFTRIAFIPGQMGTNIALCVLSRNELIGWQLTPQNVRRVRSFANTQDTTDLGQMPQN
jgi:GNAT superfamily N-acetyltransferase